MEIPGYKLVRTLGKGGMATVYLAIQEKFDREVALKVMAPSLSADPSFCERFLREAKIVAKISHPNIVAVYDVNEVGGHHYIAMEYHPGGDLKRRLREGLTVRESLRIAKDVARALDYAHSKGYLHRDIKPDNVLFRFDSSAVLTDFGIAKATEGDQNLTQMGTVAGTPKYMSPEQARGQPLDKDSDLYSLGVVLFEMLTGRLPYEATDPIALGIMHLNAPIPRLEGRVAHFQPLLDRLLAKQPAQRPQTGTQLIKEIEVLEASYRFDQDEVAGANAATAFRPSVMADGQDATVLQAASVPPTPKPAATVTPGSRTPVLAAVAGLAVVTVAGGAWFGLRDKPAPTAVAAAAVAAPSTIAVSTPTAVAPIAPPAPTPPAVIVTTSEPTAAPAAVPTPTEPVLERRPALAEKRAERIEKRRERIERRLEQVAAQPVASPADDPLKRIRINGLLGGAESALENNDPQLALQKYRQVLELDPRNREARDGMKRAQAMATP